jgi:hypothetical protein
MADILYTEEDYNPKNGLRNVYTKLKEIIQKVNTLWANAPSVTPKVYEVLLTQTGTDAPVIVSDGSGANTPLVNTLSGTPVWSYSTVGRYLLTLEGEFIVSKTTIFIGHNDITSLFSAYRVSDDVIRLECTDLALVKADDLIVNFPIKITVYP